MRRPVLILTLLSVALLSGCTGGDAPEERFPLPPAADFREGTCALLAEDVLAVARVVRGLDEPVAQPEVREELQAAQKALQTVAETAEPEVKAPLDAVVTRTGLVRIALDAERFEPSVADPLAESYDDLLDVCTGDGRDAGSATGTASTG